MIVYAYIYSAVVIVIENSHAEHKITFAERVCSIFNTRRVVVRTLIMRIRECTYIQN